MPDRSRTLPTIYVVDDEPTVRDSLRLLFQSVGMQVREFDSPQALLDFTEPLAGCLITDLRMPLMSGIDLIVALRARDCRLPVIVISGHGDVKLAVRAIKAGASDFVEKPFNDQYLLDAVNAALSTATDAAGGAALRAADVERLSQLTPREHDVLRLIVTGQPNKLIARELNLSIRTVEAHRAHIMDKLEAGSVAELVSLALRSGAFHDAELG